MSNYLFKNRLTDEATQLLLNNPAMPLMRELNFKYGLKVWRLDEKSISLAHPNGMSVCKIKYEDDKFCFYSPFFRKGRGSDENDRSTLKSNTVGRVTGLIEKHNAIISVEALTERHMKAFFSGKNLVERVLTDKHGHYANMSKSNAMPNVDLVHALLERVVRDNPNSYRYSLDVQRCNEALMHLEAVDAARDKSKQQTDEIYGGPVWAVGVYGDRNRAIVGKIMAENLDGTDQKVKVLQDFQLVLNYDELIQKFPELTAPVLMTKVAEEGNQNLMCDFFTYGDKYEHSIPYLTYYLRVDDYNCNWYFTPAAKESV